MKPLLNPNPKNLFSCRSLVVSTLAALSVFIAVPQPANAQTVVTPAGTPPHRLSAKSLSQIAALEAEADARTPAQLKINSQLLQTMKMARGQVIAPGIPTQRTSVVVDGTGMTLVDIDGTISSALLAAIQHVGGNVVGSSVRFGQMRALVPLSSVETLAALPDVRQIKPAVKSQLQNPASMHSGAGMMQRKSEVLTHLPSLLSQVDVNVRAPKLPGINFADSASASGVGSFTDEGDSTHLANEARSAFGINGSGIKVGILSDSIDNGNGIYNDALNSGDVSPVTVISGQSGGAGTGEGLAMLEVVHHLAPGAQLYFATGAAGQGQMADNIIALQQAGCKVIVDDEGYFDESPFQDPVISQAINTVTANGAMYFSSAANNGNLVDGTSSVWENDYSDSGDTSLGDGDIHSFDTNGDEEDQINANGGQTEVSLFWTDPLGKSTNDYDLFILDINGNVVASSTDRQTGSQDPYESAMANDGDYAVIVLHSGSTRYLHIDLDSQRCTFNIATTDRTRGHNAADNAFCVAATPATTGQDGNPAGPYPNPFNSSDVVETFSDDGPREVYFSANGTPFTSSLTSSGGKSLNKPDFTAADGTTTTLNQNEVGSGKEVLSPFFGTSCAAPHAGAIAALVLSYNPNLTRAQLSTILKNSATDIMASGYDLNSGAGILNAYKALQNTPSPTVATSIAVANVSGAAGQTVTLSATLATSGGGVSGQTLAFQVNHTSVGSATTNSSGTASLSYTIPSAAPAGNYPLSASYSGSSTYSASSGSSTLTVTTASVATSIAVGNVSGAAGQTVTLSATLTASGGGGVSGQTLAFQVNNTSVGSATTNSSGTASLSYTIPSGATPGSYPLSASYSGSSGHGASSGKATLTVTTASVATSIAIGNVSGAAGQTVTLSATLTASGGGGVSGQTLAFQVNNTSVGSATTNSSGTASVFYPIPSGATPGSYPLSASYSGSSGHGASSGKATLTVP